MRIAYLIKKEFIEIFRQKELLPMLFVAPFIMIFVMTHVVNVDIEQLPVDIVNLSQNKAAYRIVNRVQSSPLFVVRHVYTENRDTVDALKRGAVKAVIIFRDSLKKAESARVPEVYPEIQILMDGVDSNTSAVAAGYFNGILKNYILTDIGVKGMSMPVESRTLIRFNPELRSINYMGPGIVALLLTIIALFFTSISVVREKEQQTMDTLLISQLRPIEIYIGKAAPLAIIGMLHMILGVLVVMFYFQVPVRGNLLYLFLAAAVFLVTLLSYALLISTIVRTQQQGLFFAWFSMINFILLSGLFTPTENVPSQLQFLVKINPLAYLIKVIREIFLKGNGIEYFYRDLLAMVAIAVVIMTISLLSFKRFISK